MSGLFGYLLFKSKLRFMSATHPITRSYGVGLSALLSSVLVLKAGFLTIFILFSLFSSSIGLILLVVVGEFCDFPSLGFSSAFLDFLLFSLGFVDDLNCFALLLVFAFLLPVSPSF